MTDLLSADAAWIAPADPVEAAPLLRVAFDLDAGHGDVARATLGLSAQGVVDAWINGMPTADELLAPGWTAPGFDDSAWGCPRASAARPSMMNGASE